MNGSNRDFLEDRRSPWWLLRFATQKPPSSYFTKKIAWPVYAWRVVAPQPFDRSTNPLQRAVLRLAKASVTQKTEIARLVGIEDSLIKYIQESSFHQGFLDRNGRLTANGQAMLEEKEPPDLSQSELRPGWVFRDALGGDVLPMFFQGSLPPAPAKAVKEAVSLPYSNTFKEKPSTPGILTSLRRYGRLARLEQTEGFDAELQLDQIASDKVWADWDEVEESEPSHHTTSGAPPKLVSIINLTPEEVDLETYFYTAPDNPTTWMVQSPFNLSGKWWYKQRLEWAMERSPELQKRIDGWLKEAKEEFIKKYPSIDYVGESDRDKIIAKFPAMGICPQLHDTLTNFVNAYKSETIFKQDDSYFDTVVTRYGNTMEALLSACLNTMPQIYKRDLAQQIGTESDLDAKAEPLTEELSVDNPYRWRLSLTDAINVANNQPKSLAHRVRFLIGDAYRNRSSPFWASLKQEPNLLRHIHTLATYRNRYGAHYDSSINSANNSQIVNEVKSAAHIVISVLLANFFKENQHGQEKVIL